MPRITISDLERMLEEAEQQQRALSEKKLQAEIEAKRAGTEAEAAANAGDVQGYMTAAAKQKEAEAAAYVAGIQLKNFSVSLNRDDILAAWETYRSEYESEMAKLSAELEKIRAKFSDTFGKMLDRQNEACGTREKLAKMLGINLAGVQPGSALTDFPMQTIETARSDPFSFWLHYGNIDFSGDAAYYAHLNKLKRDSGDIRRLESIVRDRRYYAKPDKK